MLLLIPAGIVDKSMLILAMVFAVACLARMQNRIAIMAVIVGLFAHAANQNHFNAPLLYPLVDIATAAVVVLTVPRNARVLQLALWGLILSFHMLIMIGVFNGFVGGTLIKVVALLSMIFLLPKGGGARVRSADTYGGGLDAGRGRVGGSLYHHNRDMDNTDGSVEGRFRQAHGASKDVL